MHFFNLLLKIKSYFKKTGTEFFFFKNVVFHNFYKNILMIYNVMKTIFLKKNFSSCILKICVNFE